MLEYDEDRAKVCTLRGTQRAVEAVRGHFAPIETNKPTSREACKKAVSRAGERNRQRPNGLTTFNANTHTNKSFCLYTMFYLLLIPVAWHGAYFPIES